MEKSKIKEIKIKLTKTWFMIIAFFIGIPILVLPWLANKKETLEGIIHICMIISIMFIGIILTIVIGEKINYYLFKIRNSKIKMQTYMRDIPEKYSIAVGSLIYDNLLETTVDIPATVISLIGKNILKYDNGIITVVNTDISKLYDCEKYVYICIKNKERINPKKFRMFVTEEAERKGYVKKNDGNKKNRIKIAISMIITVIVCIFLSMIIPSMFGPIGMVLVAIIWTSIIVSPIVIISKQEMNKKNPYINTKLGKKEVRKLKGLKKYLQEFSMIDEKGITNAVVWEDYLAYSYMFRINKKSYAEFQRFFENNITFLDI